MNRPDENRLEIPAFILALIGIEVFFFYSFLSHGLFVKYGNRLETLSTAQVMILALLIITVSSCILIIGYGFINRKRWARKFALLFLMWAIVWPIWGIAVWSSVLEQIILTLLYVFLITYLLLYTKDVYAFRYGKYTLYKREVTLKSGKNLTIYFFSDHKPKSGTPTNMPEGYVVKVNPKSKMPYLEKYYPEAYRLGKYTLYRKTVSLRSGKSQIIYFFSEHRPKSGVPASLPQGYIVKINPRSKMPYLKKRGILKRLNRREKFVHSVEDEKKIKNKKPSNVIYVVSKPQPGQVKGDWAVRSHGKIFSHHRTKLAAIRAARRIAREREATVMVQNTNGTFSMGFKPRPRKH